MCVCVFFSLLFFVLGFCSLKCVCCIFCVVVCILYNLFLFFAFRFCVCFFFSFLFLFLLLFLFLFCFFIAFKLLPWAGRRGGGAAGRRRPYQSVDRLSAVRLRAVAVAACLGAASNARQARSRCNGEIQSYPRCQMMIRRSCTPYLVYPRRA